MKEKTASLRFHYSFSDFLYYTALLLVPVVTAMTAILETSYAGAVIFLLVAACSATLILRFFCTHCPHYTKNEKRLHCMFFWGMPKIFKQRPDRLSTMDKFLSITGTALLLLYPVYWLLQNPGLLIIYLLSLIVFSASVRRNECPRCIYTECPVNIAPNAPKD